MLISWTSWFAAISTEYPLPISSKQWVLCSRKQSCSYNVDVNSGNTNLNENMIVAVEIIAIHLKLIQLVSRSHPLPFAFKPTDSFQCVLGKWIKLCLTLLFFYTIEVTTIPCPAPLLIINWTIKWAALPGWLKSTWSCWLLQLHLSDSLTNRVSGSHFTAKLFWSLKSNSQKLITYVVSARLHKTFLR